MSEWSSCPLCGTERESGCACLNSKCADYVAPAPVVPSHPTPWHWEYHPVSNQPIALLDANGKDVLLITDDAEGHLYADMPQGIAERIVAAVNGARMAEELETAFQQLTDDFENAQAVKESQAQTIAALEQWKREQLQVTAWWATVDDYVRKHPGAMLGYSVSAEVLRLLREGQRDHNELRVCRDALDYAWTIIANAGGGDWKKESGDWQAAAVKFRDECYYPSLTRARTP